VPRLFFFGRSLSVFSKPYRLTFFDMETNTPELLSCEQEVLRLRQDGHSFGTIARQLEESGYEIAAIQEALQPLKEAYYGKRRRMGLIFIGLGATLCGLGFLVTFVQFQTGAPSDLALYGFTGVGACLAFYGGIEILGF
jgi:hypothetical protein